MTDTATPAPRPQGMLCPPCKVDLLLTERQGIEIDYCPTCRGVWLDRGELDKMIERNADYQAAAPRADAPRYPSLRDAAPAGPWGQHDEHRGFGRHGGDRHGGGHRRRGFLGGLFDD
ncbi:recombination protein RecR [Sphingomonas sp. MA1305]|jgi:Zn-finger nucleic acid-binding protein|uniref:TFIIB-type zinc ribbon-containing protein n=1 Tax=Sphingomonas sp. MA1305 TaxID=2479204 RepID=UPI001E4D0D00|nr:zf-TFIIB domain-containing protein [Sphingomonas sp. MA1305]MBI0477086.1 recombination protein RecR [Sphingomonas sp. MA1305]